MQTMKKLLSLAYFTAALAAVFSFSAFAYLDPGTLTYVISMLAGLVIAGGAALAIFWRKIKKFFQGLGKGKSGDEKANLSDDLGDEIDPMAGVDGDKD